MVKNEVTPADTFDASTVVYVFTIDWENESEKFEKKTVSELTKYDRLPDNIYLTSHPNRLEKYADSLLFTKLKLRCAAVSVTLPAVSEALT